MRFNDFPAYVFIEANEWRCESGKQPRIDSEKTYNDCSDNDILFFIRNDHMNPTANISSPLGSFSVRTLGYVLFFLLLWFVLGAKVVASTLDRGAYIVSAENTQRWAGADLSLQAGCVDDTFIEGKDGYPMKESVRDKKNTFISSSLTLGSVSLPFISYSARLFDLRFVYLCKLARSPLVDRQPLWLLFHHIKIPSPFYV